MFVLGFGLGVDDMYYKAGNDIEIGDLVYFIGNDNTVYSFNGSSTTTCTTTGAVDCDYIFDPIPFNILDTGNIFRDAFPFLWHCC